MKWEPNYGDWGKNWSWRSWFAWFPVSIGGEKVWLEFVDRKLETTMNWNDPHYVYRLPTIDRVKP